MLQVYNIVNSHLLSYAPFLVVKYWLYRVAYTSLELTSHYTSQFVPLNPLAPVLSFPPHSPLVTSFSLLYL